MIRNKSRVIEANKKGNCVKGSACLEPFLSRKMVLRTALLSGLAYDRLHKSFSPTLSHRIQSFAGARKLRSLFKDRFDGNDIQALLTTIACARSAQGTWKVEGSTVYGIACSIPYRVQLL